MIKVYTDGGYRPKYNLGAYAYMIIDNKDLLDSFDKAVSFDEIDKLTNNTMEMTAAIKGLSRILTKNYDKDNDVYFITDSQYVQLGLTKWYQSWKSNSWKNSANKKVKNIKLWHQLHSLYVQCQNKFNTITIQWVEGHSGDTMNEIVDELCNIAMDAHILKVDKNEI